MLEALLWHLTGRVGALEGGNSRQICTSTQFGAAQQSFTSMGGTRGLSVALAARGRGAACPLQ